MTTFIFGDYIYETPIFVIKALKKAEIPEALEQMEKLRRTGFLVGYIRYDAVSPVPDEEMQPDPHFEPAPYVHFVLFRHRRKLPELKPAGPAFCPSFSKHVSLRTMETMRGAVLSSNADADVEVSQEAVFSTACPGRAVYDHFVRLNPAAPHIYFKDDFEELICLSDRKLLETEKKDFGEPEYITLQAASEEDAACMASRAETCAEKGSVERRGCTVTLTFRKGAVVKDMLDAFFPGPGALGRTGTPDDLFGLELRRRGIFGGAIGVLSLHSVVLYSGCRTFEKRPDDSQYRLALGARINKGVSAQAAYEGMLAEVKELTLPSDFALEERMRLEDGSVFLLERHLTHLKKLGESHGIPVESLQKLIDGLEDAGVLPVPGMQDRFAPEVLKSSWSKLPAEWSGMVEAGGVSELRLSLKGSGALELSATRAADPAAGSKPLLGLSRKALDDRNDFMALSSNYHPWFDDALQRVAGGECFDVFFVNRFGAACCGAHSDLIFEVNGELVTPPLTMGGVHGVLRNLLVEKGVIREKEMSMTEAFAANRVFCADPVYGTVEVDLQDPRRGAK